MFCSQCGSSLIINSRFCHVCGKESSPSAAFSVNNSTSKSSTSPTTTTTGSSISTTPISTSESRTPLSFQEYRKRKEQERSSRFKSKGKQAKVETKEKDKTPSEVTINIGLRKFRDDDLKFVRGSSLPLIVRPSIGAEELLKKAAEKIVKFNRELTGGVFGFTLLYPDRTKVVTLPGSSEPFTLENYKKEIGKIYSRLTFHVCKTSDYLEFLSSYCSDSDPDFDNKIDKVRDELNTKYIRAKPDVLLRAILQYCAAMLQY